MKDALFCFLFPALLLSEDASRPERPDRHLVDVIFHFNDDNPDSTAAPWHVERTVFISELRRGTISVDNFARQSTSFGETDNQTKAKNCLALLKELEEPKDLPELPKQIVTVRCADGDKWIVRRFPINRVPIGVRQILDITGYSKDRFTTFTFVSK